MSSQQCSEQIKIFVQSVVMAKVVQGTIKNSFPRLNVEIVKENPKENPSLSDAVVISDLYDSCVEPLTDLVVPLSIKIKAVLYVSFEKDRVGNTQDSYDWSQD